MTKIPSVIHDGNIYFILDMRFFKFAFSKSKSSIKISLKRKELLENIFIELPNNKMPIYYDKLSKLIDSYINVDTCEEETEILIFSWRTYHFIFLKFTFENILLNISLS